VVNSPPFDFHTRRMTECLEQNLTVHGSLFSLVIEFEHILVDLISLYGKQSPARIQDYVALLLAVGAFRSGISGIYMSLSGYPDSARNLNRTILEIWIRLMYMSDDPEATAIGYLLYGKGKEIWSLQAEIAFRESRGMECGEFRTNLIALERQNENLKKLALDAGLDPEETRRKYKIAGVRKMVKDLGIPELKRCYEVDYRYDCDYAHSNSASSHLFALHFGDKVTFDIGPLDYKDCLATAWDLVGRLGGAISGAAEIFGNEDVSTRAHTLMDRVNELSDKITEELTG